MNTGVIDQFLNTFTTYIDSGFGLVNGEVAFLATTLVTIDVIMAALFWAWAAEEDILARLIKKTLYVGFFAFLIGNFNGLAKIVFNSFSGLGLKAAGSGLSADQFLQPGRIAQVGIDASWPILQSASSLVGFTAIINPMIWLVLAVLLIAFVIVVGSFFVLAIQLFVTLIEFKLTTLAGFVLVPFGLFGGTAFLAERVLGNVVASGVKILVLAVIIGIGTSLFSQFTQGQGFGGNQPTLQDVLAIALAALSLLGLGIYGPGIATGLASGAPQLGAGAAVGTASATWGAAVVGWSGVQTGRSLLGHAGAAASANRSARWAAAKGPSGGGPSGGGPSGGSPSGSPPSGGGGSSPPAWARRMQRRQAMTSGMSRMAQALRSGDRPGSPTSVSLRGGDR
jgi:type IV secretion system protein TrbL